MPTLARVIPILGISCLLSGQGPCSLVSDINPGAGSSQPENIADSLGEGVFFSAISPAHGRELWWSDGTPTGTRRMIDIRVGSLSSFPSAVLTWWNGARVVRLFSADDGARGRELWTTDGTALGTRIVADLLPGPLGSKPRDFVGCGDKVYFTAEVAPLVRELWVSDGTPAGTQVLTNVPGRGVHPTGMFAWRGDLYFQGYVPNKGFELYKARGSSVQVVRDIHQGIGDGYPGLFTPHGGELYFVAQNSLERGGELWATDGSAAGTRLVVDLTPASRVSSSPFDLVEYDGNLYFTARIGSARQLYRTDGTAAGTVPLNPGVPVDRLYRGGDGLLISFGNDLYATDGTAAGTTQVSDGFILTPQAAGTGAYFVRGFFSGEVFFSDGTVSGTSQICDLLRLGSAQSRELTVSGNQIFFHGIGDNVGSELFVIRWDRANRAELGAGCGPIPPRLSSSFPILGRGLRVRCDNAPASGPSVLLIGLPAAPSTLPILSAECAAWLDLSGPLGMRPVPSTPRWTQSIGLPNSASLVGLSLRMQTAHDPLPLSLSNAVELHLGR